MDASIKTDAATPSVRRSPTPDICSAGSRAPVITVDVAAEKAVSAVKVVSCSEALGLPAALGRVLAMDIEAQLSLPPFDASAMDGYAVRIRDLDGGGPWLLRVGGRVAAGDRPGEGLSSAQAVRILTGAIVPASFDAVVVQERCRVQGDYVTVLERPEAGANIRRRGEDVCAGDTLAAAGTPLTPNILALLAGQGVAAVVAFRKIRVALVSTGSELRNVGEALDEGQIYNSNRTMLTASLAELPWVEIVDFGIVRDDAKELAGVFLDASRRCDVVLTTGGVSAGDEDHVLSAVGASGGLLDVLKVAMRPGKPVKVGLLGDALFVGLPGNPNAAAITFRMIALPALCRMAGMVNVETRWLSATAAFDYGKKLGRTEFVPVRLSNTRSGELPSLTLVARGSSASLRTLAEANAIALLPADLTEVRSGMPLQFQLF